MKAYELKQGWRAAVLAMSIVLAACGSDESQNNGGGAVGVAPGSALSPNGINGGVSNCVVPGTGQPGILVQGYNGYQQCMPNMGNTCGGSIYNTTPNGGSALMCPCSGATGGGCGGNNSVFVNNAYYFWFTPNNVAPGSYVPTTARGDYYWEMIRDRRGNWYGAWVWHSWR